MTLSFVVCVFVLGGWVGECVEAKVKQMFTVEDISWIDFPYTCGFESLEDHTSSTNHRHLTLTLSLANVSSHIA